MTWSWVFTKIGIGIGLGAISSNPVGWAIGIPASQIIKTENYKKLNSSNLTLSDKESSLRLIEISTDYQWGAGLGIVGKGLGTVANQLSKETLKVGKTAGKEIAANGFKTELAKALIAKGQNLSKVETIIRSLPSLHELEEKIKGIGNLVIELLSSSSNETEFIENANILIKAKMMFIEELDSLLERKLFEKRNLLNSIKENILKINKANVEIYIRNQKNKDEHRKINWEINQALTRIKLIQQKLHNQNNCCEKCRFC